MPEEEILTERDKVNARYQAEHGKEVQDPPPEKSEEEKSKPDDYRESEKPPGEGLTGEKTLEVVKEEIEKKKEPDLKGALHEEREKRKAASARNKELERQLQTVLQDVKRLMDEKEKPPTEAIEDYEKEILDLKKTLRELGSKVDSHESTEAEKFNRQKKLDIDMKIKQADEDLEKEGFPLFSEMVDKVTKEIVKLRDAEETPEGQMVIVKEYDNPEGWKKLYKEKIFPYLYGKLSKRQKADTDAKKIEAKKEAQLTGSPGQKPKTDDEEKPWSYDDYLTLRTKNSAVRR